MIGVGLIGTGFMGKCHALAWNAVGTVFGDAPEMRLVHLGEANERPRNEAGQRIRLRQGFRRLARRGRRSAGRRRLDHHAQPVSSGNGDRGAGSRQACLVRKADGAGLRRGRGHGEAAKHSGKVAALGYNYIQSPAIRHIRTLLDEKIIGDVNHLRIEMDEDFMADPDALFFWKHEAASGYGALDDFAVHPLSLVSKLFGRVARVMCDMAKPYADRQVAGGGRRAVETYDIASVLMRLENGISGTLLVNRSAWGRKGRIAIQIFGSKGSILFDQERFNEFQLYVTADRPTEQGYRTILIGPQHKPYDRFIPAPGPWPRLQRSEDHRMPRTDRPPCRQARQRHRVRRGAGDRTHRSRHGAVVR